ncbi:hypothetical protein [Mycobacterium sp. NPDC050853]|uniref:hypothetical protein n=1 Tax=Mycobacterium sp. NPDC050853 TaxID=3155160 RepID=UPI0033FD3030
MTNKETNSDDEHIDVLITGIRRNRATITRRRTSVKQAQDHQKVFIREALEMGVPPKRLARESGLTMGRISQIRNEGGRPVSMFDLT